jgi:hypothetical protein
MSKVSSTLQHHAEDIALIAGAVGITVGSCIEFGIGVACLVFGALSVAYGVWITERRS